MDDVQRVFRRLVEVLAEQAPDRLYLPIPLMEVHETIIPYRHHRRELRFEAIEDYEMAILRLLAGEGGYVAVEPDEVREFLAREAAAVHPSSAAFRRFEHATVTLNPGRVRSMLDPRVAYAPSADQPTASPEPDESAEPAGTREPDAVTPEPAPVGGSELSAEPSADSTPPVPTREAADRSMPGPLPTCATCHTALPLWRSLTYCPFCGSSRPQADCPRCGERMEQGWRFCVACGEPIEDVPAG